MIPKLLNLKTTVFDELAEEGVDTDIDALGGIDGVYEPDEAVKEFILCAHNGVLLCKRLIHLK